MMEKVNQISYETTMAKQLNDWIHASNFVFEDLHKFKWKNRYLPHHHLAKHLPRRPFPGHHDSSSFSFSFQNFQDQYHLKMKN